MGKVKEVPDYPKGLTFEHVWATIERMSKEADIRQKEAEKRQKELDRRIGYMGDRFGEMVESMVVPNLWDKFRELGFVFSKAYQNATIKDEKNNIVTEIDITLENGDKVMIVEVKTKPSIRDVQDHIERMEKVRRHADLHNDKRKFLGAIAGVVIKENIRDFIYKNGFYVIEPSGETFMITPPNGNAKEW